MARPRVVNLKKQYRRIMRKKEALIMPRWVLEIVAVPRENRRSGKMEGKLNVS